MRGKVAVLREDLLLVVLGEDATHESMEAFREHLGHMREDLGVRAVLFGGLDMIDMREAPPEINGAAERILEWLDQQ